MLALPTRSSGERRTHPSEGEELICSAGSGMLIGDPLVRGAMLALPITSSGEWRTHSFRMRGNSDSQKGRRHAQR